MTADLKNKQISNLLARSGLKFLSFNEFSDDADNAYLWTTL